MRPIRILELRSVVGTGGGPEKTILQGTARTDPEQFAITVCYIRDLRDSRYDLGERARAAGVDYVEIQERHSLDPRVAPALRELCRSRNIQIVHAHEYKTDLLAWLLGRTVGTIPLATAHGWTGHSWRERNIYYPADKRLLARFPRVIAVSGEIQRELIRTGCDPSAVHLVLNGIDPAAFQRDPGIGVRVRQDFGLRESGTVIGSVGRLEPQKRFDLLIDAFATLRSKYPDLQLIIAGDGSRRESLQSQIERLGLAGACRLAGHVADVRRLHHALDIFVQSSDYEGTSNAVLEAMAMETTVVATDAGGTAELLDHGACGIVLPRGSSRLLADALDGLLDDPGRAAMLRTAARQRVEGPLSFAARMHAVEAVYRELCDARESPVIHA